MVTMTALTVFIDDSKDALAEKYSIAAGVLASKASWNAFNKEWRSTLRSTPTIRYFHASEWRGMKKEFAQFRENGECTERAHVEANRKRNALLNIIRSHLRSISVAVDVQAWKRVKADHPRPLVIEENPYKTALQELIYAIAKEVRLGDYKLEFICDSDNRATTYQQIYSDFRKKNPETAKKISRTLAFANDEVTYGLQAADLVAHMINQTHQQYGLEARDLPPPTEIAGLMSKVHVWDYEYGMAVLDAQSINP